jgi:hypothetical protein
MKPRWIDDDRSTKDGRVGYTLIAKWRPWLYYLICTFRIDGKSPVQRMISGLDTGLPMDRTPVRADYFVTRVVRCNRFGRSDPTAEPLLEREYQTIDQAKLGHEEAVSRFGVSLGTSNVNSPQTLHR